MDLTLTSDQLQNLRRIAPGASQDDLCRTYSFEHPLNAHRTLKRAWLDAGVASTKFRWHLLFFEAGGSCILEDQTPVARSAMVARLVSATATDLVVSNDNLFLDESFRSRGFAGALYAAERELYERWGVREIWLRAQRDGLVVWMKPEFGFKPLNPGFLRRRYRASTGSTPDEDPVQYPEAFLRQQQDVQLYKVIGQ